MAPTLYYLAASPPCRAVMMAAKALGVELNLQELDILDKKEHMEPWFLNMNPAHGIPTLEVDGFAVGESRAIMGFLVNEYGKNDSLYPKNSKERAVVDQMLNFDLGSIAGTIVPCLAGIIFKKTEPDQEQVDKVKDKLSILNTYLQKHAFAAGSKLTIADFSLISYITVLDILGIDFSSYKNVCQWVKRMKELPYYDEVNQKGFNLLSALVKSRRDEMKSKA